MNEENAKEKNLKEINDNTLFGWNKWMKNWMKQNVDENNGNENANMVKKRE